MKQSLTDIIVQKIQKNIESGEWQTGKYIPATRTIAEQENVSRGVVTAAVSILVGKGMLERVPRHGIRVTSATCADSSDETVGSLARRCLEIIESHRTGENNHCRTEDLRAFYETFKQIMDEGGNSVYSSASSLITAEDAMLYDRGIKCAGWSPDRYTLYKCNLTKQVDDLIRGTLLGFTFDPADRNFDEKTMDYVEKRVHPNDANNYLAVMNRAQLIEKSKYEDFFTSLEYREKKDDSYRWVKLNLNASIDGATKESVLYLLYQDINEEKINELLLKERTEEDALTGALNRRAFMLQAQQLLSESGEEFQHAFLMLDVDGFKAVNDTFGHPVGDTVLSDLSKALHTILRHGDLFGRIGGDEFMICLKNIPFDAVIEKKAAQINEIMRRDFDNGAKISGSIGIAVFPRDGQNYEQLYSEMDIALYHAKENGKDRFEFYRKGMKRSDDGVTIGDPIKDETEQLTENPSKLKKKILVVDDNELNRNIITGMISDEYTVLQAKDGRRALLTLRRYGVSISAVLLDLIMPGMDGFEVLRKMQCEPILKSIPVIIITGSEDDDSEFRAIETGAIDFIKKPVDQRLLKVRLRNSVNKQENERLRVQNSYLLLQGEEEQRYRHIVKSTGTIVIEHDWVNSVFTYDKDITEYLAGTYDHRPLWRIFLSDMVASSMDVKMMQTMIYRLANSHTDNQATLRVKLKTNNNEKHWFTMNAIKTGDGFNLTSKLLITFNDINKDILVEDKLRNLVEYDSLTGIYNRTAFLEKADKIIKESKNGKWLLSVIDIDGFKVFNHMYGHDEGDRLLMYAAKHINTSVSRFGGICGRLQADVFAVLQPSRRDYIDTLAENRTNALLNYNKTMKITSSTGRYYIDDITLPINTILDKAMIAHRIAKTGLVRDVYFTDDMQKKLISERTIVSEMEQALAEQRFKVYFQPIFDYKTKNMITAEALVRWVAPNGRIIPPNDFIPLFEQNGFIVKLDEYVWEKACEHMRSWLNAGIDIVPISVNVSRMDVYAGNFVKTIIDLAEKYRIPPMLLRLEITESAYMRNSQQLIESVEELRRRGFTIEMDDFGSGFSSLNILSEVPVDILKLDMRFILGEDKTGRKSKIMGHIINMAKSSNMDVIAEGVETEEQAELLNSLGCMNMQGFYFSKPVDEESFIKFFQKEHSF